MGFAQQPNQGNSFADAFQKGYGLMDSIYQSQRQKQLTSKLAQLYAENPNMDSTTRMRKTVPLLALYGDVNKAVELDKAITQQEQNDQYRNAVLTQRQTNFDKPKTSVVNGHVVRINPDGTLEDLGAFAPIGTPKDKTAEPTAKIKRGGKVIYVRRSESIGEEAPQAQTLAEQLADLDNSGDKKAPPPPPPPPSKKKKVKVNRPGHGIGFVTTPLPGDILVK